jgi:hypothetical protein
MQRARDVGELVGVRGREIEREYCRLRVTGRYDFVVERFELAHRTTVQHDRFALRSAAEREGAAQASGRPGDQNDFVGEGNAKRGARRR